jgi:indole-3-glycerol phosphate synthase
MHSFLEKILLHKRQQVTELKQRTGELEAGIAAAAYNARGDLFASRLRSENGIRCIAEIKRSSPSKGLIRADFDPGQIAAEYNRIDVAAISVLTETEFFKGDPSFIAMVKAQGSVPVLRKDFILDPVQVMESALIGADAFLLIVRILDSSELATMIELGRSLGMEALVEVHSAAEIETAVRAGAKIIGVNNRDLETFITDIQLSEELVRHIPADCIRISESGLRGAGDIARVARAGYDAVLIGEHFMRSDDIPATYQDLFRND